MSFYNSSAILNYATRIIYRKEPEWMYEPPYNSPPVDHYPFIKSLITADLIIVAILSLFFTNRCRNNDTKYNTLARFRPETINVSTEQPRLPGYFPLQIKASDQPSRDEMSPTF